jgi:hypothetical protein
LFMTAAAVGMLGLLCAGCGPGATQAQADAKTQATMTAGTSANATGCVQVVADSACKTLKGAGGVLYDVSNAGIDLSRGKGVSLMGRDNGETTPCGKVLTDVKYDYLGISCAAPVAQAPAAATPAG